MIAIVESLAIDTKETIVNYQKQETISRINIALYDEININRPIKAVWEELRDFPIWFFSSEGIKRVKGEPVREVISQ